MLADQYLRKRRSPHGRFHRCPPVLSDARRRLDDGRLGSSPTPFKPSSWSTMPPGARKPWSGFDQI